MAAAAEEYGSGWELATFLIALALQFCSWSAWRMKRTSMAFSIAGSGLYFASVILNIIDRKLPAYLSSLSGYTYGSPMMWR